MSDSAPQVTRLLLAWREGDTASRDALIAHVYDELHRLAERHFRHEKAGHTLQPTALIHEAFIRLVDADVQWNSRTHFFAVASRVIRQVLVDHAKARGRHKRGSGDVAVTLDDALVVSPDADDRVVDLDEALKRLEARDARKARAIELHYFGGLTYDEIASALAISTATVQRELRMAKAWLHQELNDPTPETAPDA